jgi:hypothetical protein
VQIAACRRAVAALVALAGALAGAATASAQTTAAEFSCRASAARVSLPATAPLLDPPPVVEPFVANKADAPCRDDNQHVLAPTTALTVVTADLVDATTTAAPKTPAAEGQGVSSIASVTHPKIALPGLTIAADVLEATATAKCVGGKPALASDGKVVQLTINGNAQAIPPDDNQQIPLGPLGTLTLNQVDTTTDGTLVRRALHLESPLGTVAIAEAKVGITGAVCAATEGSGALPGSASGGRGSARLVVTPRAAARRIASGRCVAGSFKATVKGRRIRRVVFSLDGRTIRTDRKSPFTTRVRPAVGRHTLRARVTFTGGGTRTLRLPFRRCAPAAPTFTG